MKEIIRNAYRKFKYFVFNAGSLEYVKPKIADFESDYSRMELTFETIDKALKEQNLDYFQSLIKKISTKVFPKSFKTIVGEGIISNEDDGNIIVDRINFFIDCPIEIYILDTFWSCLMAGASSFENNIFKHSFGNSVNRKVISKTRGKQIIDRIDFSSLYFYSRYFPKYKQWRNEAVKTLEKKVSNKDCTMLSLDITRFYYNVNVSFEDIFNRFSKNGSDFSKYMFIHKIMEKVYLRNKRIIKYYDKTIADDILPIPIGLMSSGLVANIYMSNLDQAIYKRDGVEFYGRYVDDMLIVFSKSTFEKTNDAILNIFGEIVTPCLDDEENYVLTGTKLVFKKSKTKMFKILQKESKSIIHVLKNESFVVSEQRLFPDVTLDIEHFKGEIYKRADSIKVRDKNNLVIDTKKMISLINGYLNSKKFKEKENTNKELTDKLKEIKNVIADLFNTRDLLSLYSKWNKIILFCQFAGFNKMVGDIKNKITKGLNRIVFEPDEGVYSYKKSIIIKIRESLNLCLCVSLSQKSALLGEKKGALYRKANLLDHYFINYPTINYYTIPDNFNLFFANFRNFNALSGIHIDENKLLYSPKFIHLGSYLSTANLVRIINDNRVPNQRELYEYYKNHIAHIFGSFEDLITFSDDENLMSITFKPVNKMEGKKNSLIGLTNINLDKHKMLDNGKYNDEYYGDKSHLIDMFALLNSCDFCYWEQDKDTGKKGKKKKMVMKKRHLDYLVFPELYLEIEYLPYLEFFSRNTGTTIIVGLKYIISSNFIHNIQAVIVPFIDSRGHKCCYTYFREKNNYSPTEKKAFNGTYYFNESSSPIYYRFTNQDQIKYTAFICYELTDINARAAMQNKIDILFASEFNADITYFSSIIESASRELYCYVAQVNSSNYGDTRIVGPFRKYHKTIASVSGGIKSLIHVDKVDVKMLNDYIKTFVTCDATGDYSKISDEMDQKFKKPSVNVKER